MIKIVKLIVGVLICYIPPLFAIPCDPFTISCRNAAEILTQYPISALSMAGSIQKQNHIWAIIKAPDQHVYLVAAGSSIGLGGGKILHITSRQIIIQQEKNSVTMRLRQVK